jgi:hypothetical protein
MDWVGGGGGGGGLCGVWPEIVNPRPYVSCSLQGPQAVGAALTSLFTEKPICRSRMRDARMSMSMNEHDHDVDGAQALVLVLYSQLGLSHIMCAAHVFFRVRVCVCVYSIIYIYMLRLRLCYSIPHSSAIPRAEKVAALGPWGPHCPVVARVLPVLLSEAADLGPPQAAPVGQSRESQLHLASFSLSQHRAIAARRRARPLVSRLSRRLLLASRGAGRAGLIGAFARSRLVRAVGVFLYL